MSIVAKMQVNSVVERASQVDFSLNAVYSNYPTNENKSFSDATPTAYLNISISKSKDAVNYLKQGDIVYLTFQVSEDSNPWKYLGDGFPFPDGVRVELAASKDATEFKIATVRVNKRSEQRQNYSDLIAEDGLIVDVRDSASEFKYWRYVVEPKVDTRF